MKIVTTGAFELLMDRIQCMRETNASLDDKIDHMITERDECCSSSGV